MNLPKAIELCEDIEHTGEYEGDPDDSDALKLLIEAGKRLQLFRSKYGIYAFALLPGETP